MGVIYNKPLDGSITGAEKLLGSDSDNTTVNLVLNDIVTFALGTLSSIKNVSSSVYDGLLIIAGEGNTSMTSVEAGDILMGINAAFTGGIFRVMVADINSPADQDDTTLVEFIASAVASDYEIFSATNGQVAFILGTTPTNVDVSVDRVPQIPGTDFTLAGNTVTMTYAQDAGSVLVIRTF